MLIFIILDTARICRADAGEPFTNVSISPRYHSEARCRKRGRLPPCDSAIGINIPVARREARRRRIFRDSTAMKPFVRNGRIAGAGNGADAHGSLAQ